VINGAKISSRDLRWLVRSAVPRGSRLLFYYLRRAFTSRGAERLDNVAEVLCLLGWRQHEIAAHGDLRILVDIGDHGVGRPLWSGECYEPVETAFFRSIIRPADVFVDIGANIGYYSTLAAKLVGPGGKVIAIEPGPYNFELLTRNIRRNRFSNVILQQLALSDFPGKVELNLSRVNFGDNRVGTNLSVLGEFESDSVEVRAERLDDLLTRLNVTRVENIKMDVQGYEAQVQEGMLKTLSRYVSTVATEFWPAGLISAGGDPHLYLSRFRELGFRAGLVTSDGVVPVEFDGIFDAIPRANRADAEWVNLILRRARPD